jgi:tRNA threonylcarbamoyladenosine biosynthesis protein TsaE
MTALSLDVASLDETALLGAALAEYLPEGSVVELNGPLGAGKTELVRSVAAACGVDPRDVTSPTFVLIHEYQGRRPLFHFDAYRLTSQGEFLQLGPDEYFESPGLSLIEWGGRVAACLPAERLAIDIEVTGPYSRRMHFRARGERYVQAVKKLRRKFAQRQCDSTCQGK